MQIQDGWHWLQTPTTKHGSLLLRHLPVCRFSRTVEAISNVCFSLLPAFQVSSQIPWMFSTFLALKYQDLFTFALLDRSDRGNVYAMTAFNIFLQTKHRNNVEFRVHGITNLIHISGPLELPLLFLARKAVMLEVPPAAVLPRCFIWRQQFA